MLVSHHAPCDYDRTVRILGVRTCTRCLGMFSGTFVGWQLERVFARFDLLWCLIGAMALTLPAAFDFAAHELSTKYRSNNIRRFGTGLIFGFVIGACLVSLRNGNPWPFLGFIAYLAVMQFVIVRLFQIHGHSDSYLERYASAVYINSEVEPSPPPYSSPAAGSESGEA